MVLKPLLLPDPYVFPAWPPELPERRPGDPGPEYVVAGTLLGHRQGGVSLEGRTQNGTALAITLGIVAPGVVRVLLEAEPPDPNRVTLARGPSGPVACRVEETSGRIEVVSDLVRVRVELDPFGIAFLDGDGRVILEQNYTHRDATGRLTMLPFGYSAAAGRRVAFHDTFTAEPDEHWYGFGEKFMPLDKRGQRLEMWAHNTYGIHGERAYKNVPFFMSTRGYGIFVDSVTCTRFDMAASNPHVFSIIVPDTALDYYVIVGPHPQAIITRYAGLVGHPPLVPKWGLGLWMSSGFQHDSAQDVLSRARRLRELGIPCDVLHLDCYWQKHGHWSDLEWDREAFPDPEGLVRQMRELGFRVSLWENPYLGVESPRFAEAREKGYLLRTPQGEPYVLDLWDGYHSPVGFYDLTHPEAVAWFKDLHRPLLRMGVDVFKTDFGESVPPDAVAHNGMTGERLHNLYPLLYNDAVVAVIEEETGHPGVVWARSTFAGGQRHAAQWGADCDSSYQSLANNLRAGLSIGLCGHAYWSHDIGGFYGQPSPELYVRWAQFGLLSPLSRPHGVTSRLPWDYGERALGIFRDYVRLRYRLLPYLYTYAHIAAETSLPIMRAMFLEFPDDPNTYALDLQYMLGSELLVAPIYNSEGRRPVYLPAGRWIDYWTNQVIQGPTTLHVEVPLERVPLYVRGNALVPTIEPPHKIAEGPFDLVTFDAYLLDRGHFTLRDADGVTHLSATRAGSRLEVEVSGAREQLGLRLVPLPGLPAPRRVIVNGRALRRQDGVSLEPGGRAGWCLDADGTVRAMIES